MCKILVITTWFVAACAFIVLATAGIASGSDAAYAGAFVSLICNGLSGIALALVSGGDEEF